MEKNNILEKCICFGYIFSDDSKTGLSFFCETTRENVSKGVFDISLSDLKVCDWDEKYDKYDGNSFFETRYGYLTRKTFKVSHEELYRICNLFDDASYSDKKIVVINETKKEKKHLK